MLNSQFKPIEGKLVYKKTDEDAKETLDVNNDVPMTITLTFSAENITVGAAEHDNRWPKA